MTQYEATMSGHKVDLIADILADKGFVSLHDFLPENLAQGLLNEAEILSGTAFKPAGIGRNDDQHLNTQVRTDTTFWLNNDSPYQVQYLDFMQQLRGELNRRLFMGLFDFECHFSHYKKGDFYLKHLDAFKGRSNRVLSTVYYLNHDWVKADGGELALYSPDEQQDIPLALIEPVFNLCVIFLSDRFPHEVLASHKDRYSIAGWFRINGSVNGKVDPAS